MKQIKIFVGKHIGSIKDTELAINDFLKENYVKFPQVDIRYCTTVFDGSLYGSIIGVINYDLIPEDNPKEGNV